MARKLRQHDTLHLLLLLFIYSLTTTTIIVNALQIPTTLPPKLRLSFANNPSHELQKIKQDVLSSQTKSISNENKLHWEVNAKEGYQIATSIFHAMQQKRKEGEGGCIVCFPSITTKKEEGVITNLVNVLQKNANILHLKEVECKHYPKAPCSLVSLTFVDLLQGQTKQEKEETSKERKMPMVKNDTIIKNTESWVNNFLSKYRLCPYTASVQNAAVGLSSVGVAPGPVSIIVVGDDNKDNDNDDDDESAYKNDNDNQAVNLLSSFWSSVSYLLSTPETTSSTILLVDPTFDDDFSGFYNICDDIVEPSVVATDSIQYIGRAWFHPLYDADIVQHTQVLPGHAIPHDMVKSFATKIKLQQEKEEEDLELNRENIAQANDLVRRTPHATINILRRNQLQAASKYEQNLPEKNRIVPNSIYVRNVKRLLSSPLFEQNEGDEAKD